MSGAVGVRILVAANCAASVTIGPGLGPLGSTQRQAASGSLLAERSHNECLTRSAPSAHPPASSNTHFASPDLRRRTFQPSSQTRLAPASAPRLTVRQIHVRFDRSRSDTDLPLALSASGRGSGGVFLDVRDASITKCSTSTFELARDAISASASSRLSNATWRRRDSRPR